VGYSALKAAGTQLQQTMTGWKTHEIGVRRGANHSQVGFGEDSQHSG
jgi:hypothetical protein